MINLLTKRFAKAYKADALRYAKKHQLDKAHDRFAVGDKITFWAGYNGDIRYLSEITGIDENGDIFVVWDCFWFPIQDNDKRKIEIAA